MRITLKSLHYLMTAVDRGSIARAAEELNVVPSAVSAAIDLVEDEFGLHLVTRHRARGIAPTASGRAMFGKIRHLLEEYDSLLSEGSELRSALSGVLRVGYYAPVAPAFMPTIVAGLMEGNPSVEINLVECDNDAAQDGLLVGAYDAIVFVAEGVRPGIAYETLIEAPPYLLCGAGHRLARHRSVPLGELADERFVLLDLPLVSAYYRTLLDGAGIAPSVVATASSTEMVRSLVGSGIGCAVLNMRPRSDVSYAGDRLCVVPIAPQPPPLRLALGHLTGNPRRLVSAFIARCRVEFASAAANELVAAAPAQNVGP